MYYKDNGKDKNTIIDIENYPLSKVDKETSEILDDLTSKNKLQSRKVRYFIISSGEILKSTGVLEEFSYNNRKFVKEQKKRKIEENGSYDIFYWLEIKPIKIDKEINDPKTR